MRSMRHRAECAPLARIADRDRRGGASRCSSSAGIVVSRRERAVPLDQNLVAVAPFDVVDADLKLWHEGMVDVLSRNLDGAGPLRTVSPTRDRAAMDGTRGQGIGGGARKGDGREARRGRQPASLGRRLGARIGIADRCQLRTRARRGRSQGCAVPNGSTVRFADDRPAARARKVARARRRANVVGGNHIAAGAQGISRGAAVFPEERVGFSGRELRSGDRERFDVQHRAHVRRAGARLGWWARTIPSPPRTCSVRRSSITDSRRETACSSWRTASSPSWARRATPCRSTCSSSCSRRCTRECAGTRTIRRCGMRWATRSITGDGATRWACRNQRCCDRSIVRSRSTRHSLRHTSTPLRLVFDTVRRMAAGIFSRISRKTRQTCRRTGCDLVDRLTDPARATTPETRQILDTASVRQLHERSSRHSRVAGLRGDTHTNWGNTISGPSRTTM